jgi:hypothetical protein
MGCYQDYTERLEEEIDCVRQGQLVSPPI